jgi:hypothetical protein
MNSEAELLQKLMVSKKIMDKHNNMERGQGRNINMGGQSMSSPMLESYDAVPASYNIPQEYMQEQQRPQQMSTVGVEDRISKSKLPDEIKKLMMEHPIQQPNMGMSSGAVLSDDLVEKAARLMNSNPKGEQLVESNSQRRSPQPQSTSQFNMNELRKVVRETVEEVLSENGLLVENESKSSDMFKFRVGQHLFEGKVLKVKKMTK